MDGPSVRRVRGKYTSDENMEGVVFSLPGASRGGIKVCVEGRRVHVEGSGRGVKYSGVRRLKRSPETIILKLSPGEVRVLSTPDMPDPEETGRIKAEREELRRRLQSLARDVEIIRRRAEEEKMRVRQETTSLAALKVIEVLDNIERALNSSGKGEGLLEGIEILRRDILRVLRSMGVEEIEAEGKPLDPRYHHAVKTVVDPQREEGTVVKVLQKGYTMEGKVLRPAMVVVAEREGGDAHGKGAGD